MNNIYVLCIYKDGIFDRPQFFRTYDEAHTRLVDFFSVQLQIYNDVCGCYDDVVKKYGDPTKIPTEAFEGGAVINGKGRDYNYICENSYMRIVLTNLSEFFSPRHRDIGAEVFAIERGEIPDEFNSEKYVTPEPIKEEAV